MTVGRHLNNYWLETRPKVVKFEEVVTMETGNAMSQSAFGMFFTKNVPHIFEEIFFQLDYESFKNCLDVSQKWRELLTSESFKRKGKIVFQNELKSEQNKLWNASKNGETTKVRRLVRSILSAGMVNVDFPSTKLTTPLFEAASNGHLKVVKILMNAGAEINKGNRYGISPLSIASRIGLKDVVKMLLNSGADPNSTDIFGTTPLNEAAYNNLTDVVQLLLDGGADPNIGTHVTGITALQIAAIEDHCDVAELLLERGANPNVVYKTDKRTPLHLAAWKGHTCMVELLLDRGAMVNKVAQGTGTPLHVAAYLGKIGVVQLLLDKGANPDMREGRGVTPIVLAIQRGHVETIRILQAASKLLIV